MCAKVVKAETITHARASRSGGAWRRGVAGGAGEERTRVSHTCGHGTSTACLQPPPTAGGTKCYNVTGVSYRYCSSARPARRLCVRGGTTSSCWPAATICCLASQGRTTEDRKILKESAARLFTSAFLLNLREGNLAFPIGRASPGKAIFCLCHTYWSHIGATETEGGLGLTARLGTLRQLGGAAL